MPLTVVSLPTQTITTSGTNSTGLTFLDDATSVILMLNSTTTSGANTAAVQVELTDTGTTWLPLLYNSSGASAVTVSSSGCIYISPVTFRQIRLVTTGALAQSVSILAARQITV